MKKLIVSLMVGIIWIFGASTGYCETTAAQGAADTKEIQIKMKMEFVKMSSENYSHREIWHPILMVINNMSGTIAMGDIVPLKDGTKEEVGTYISLLPKIENNQIVIHTKSDISYISEFDKAGNPIIQRNVTEADLICKNNQTVILGGLIGETQENIVFVKITPEIQNP